MDIGISVFRNRRQVITRGVPLVSIESISRIARVQFVHHAIARDLCDYRRRGDGGAPAVAVDDRPLCHHQVRDPERIDQDEIR